MTLLFEACYSLSVSMERDRPGMDFLSHGVWFSDIITAHVKETHYSWRQSVKEIMLLMKLIAIFVCKTASSLNKKIWHCGGYHLASETNSWSSDLGQLPAAKYPLSWLLRWSKFRHHPDFCVHQTDLRDSLGGRENHQTTTSAQV